MITIKNTTGGVLGTQILDESGNDICKMLGVSGISVSFAGPHAPVMADVTVGMVHAEISPGVTAWLVTHPVTKKFEAVESIHFKDGTQVIFGTSGVNVYQSDGSKPDPIYTSVTSMTDGHTYKFRKPDTDIT